MSIPLQLQSFTITNKTLALYAPVPDVIQQLYHHNKEAAYWTQVWPAAVGLCYFLQQHSDYVAGRKVLEMAAGLGLPGLYAADIASEVQITDKEELSIICIRKSISHLQLMNTHADTLNWNDATIFGSLPDVLLLSDVNYEPAIFDELFQVILFFLHRKVTVIISTPQRLVAKTFINSILPYCVRQWNHNILLHKKETGVSVFVLKQ